MFKWVLNTPLNYSHTNHRQVNFEIDITCVHTLGGNQLSPLLRVQCVLVFEKESSQLIDLLGQILTIRLLHGCFLV